LKGDKRLPFGLPTVDNGNYLWIQIFYSALHSKGRAGFVMANSAADARGSELEIRKKLIQSGDVDAIVSIGPNFFYTVTLPCTLWFFDKNKKKTLQKDTVLFLDARSVFTQIDRAHREFSPQQLEYLANVVRLYRGEDPELKNHSEKMLKASFPKTKYRHVAGLCRMISLKEIEKQGWSLNPGRYVGAAENRQSDIDFKMKLKELNKELERLNGEARELEEQIAGNVLKLLNRIS
jgi:type I restriction enzyme M protein